MIVSLHPDTPTPSWHGGEAPPPKAGRPVSAVFLDRDGVINQNHDDHVKSWQEFQFIPGAPEAVARLTRGGTRVFVVTNQAVINRGVVSREVVEDINRRMTRELERRGGRIEAVAYCPHRPEQRCGCRKPQPGMLLGLARQHRVDLQTSVVIGDALADVEAGLAAGCQAMLVLTGRGRDQLARAAASGLEGFIVAPDLSRAVELVLPRALSAALDGPR
jgi:D-glycero-D-manno-heptose 1,7-bisphosphate phosphatase